MHKYVNMVWLGLVLMAASAVAQTVVGTEFTSAPNDEFGDWPNTMSHYGLTWGEFSNGTIGPSAMLSGYGGINLYTLGTRRVTVGASGNVGIGTTTPNSKFDVITNGTGVSIEPGDGVTYFGTIGFNREARTGAIFSSNAHAYQFTHTGSTIPTSDYLALEVYNPSGSGVTGQAFVINGVGNVGIGTTLPSAKMEVNGGIKLTSNSGGSIVFQDGTTQSTAYTGVLCGGDYAETVDVAGDRKNYEPGDVLVIGQEAGFDVLKSSEPYSTLVVGVYSTKPGVVGRRQTTDPKISTTEVPMAMIGIVPIKVSAENGPIKRGDLLVTSSTAGYAMKGTDRSRLTGAVIGKALGSLDSGTGMIEVVVTLQ